MQDTDFKGLNTTVVVKSTKLLKSSDYASMLRQDSLEKIIDIVDKADYAVKDDVLVTKNFDSFMMSNLDDLYDEMYALSPDSRVIDIKALRYEYHNLKILFKERLVSKDFSSMYIPLGKHDVEDLKILVETSEKPKGFHEVMLNAVDKVKYYIRENESEEGISILLDKAYLEHSKAISEAIGNSEFSKRVDMFIDFNNLSILARSINQNRSTKALRQALSPFGSHDVEMLVDLAKNKDLTQIIDLYSRLPYGDKLKSVKFDQSAKAIDITALEQTLNDIEAEYMREGSLVAFGPLPILTYLYFKENEIDNIRLILVGEDNQLSREAIEERMRPIYDL